MSDHVVEQGACDDCISRDAVLNLKREFYDPMGNAMLIYPSDVEELQSVSPKIHVSEGAKYYLKALFNSTKYGTYAKTWLEEVINTLDNPESTRYESEWIPDSIASNIYKCKKCGNDAPVDPTSGQEYQSNFCPTCGSIMNPKFKGLIADTFIFDEDVTRLPDKESADDERN